MAQFMCAFGSRRNAYAKVLTAMHSGSGDLGLFDDQNIASYVNEGVFTIA